MGCEQIVTIFSHIFVILVQTFVDSANVCFFISQLMRITYPYPVHTCPILDTIDIAYMDEGRGEQTILFIHGLANYAPVWKHQVKELSKTNRCIAIDLPGNGYSSRGDFPYSMFFYAECVARFIEKMNLSNVVLAGHSMGGQIAIILGLRYPHLLDKLILVAPAGLEYFAPHEILLMKGMMQMGTLFYADELHLESAIRQSFFSTQNESATIIDELKSFMNAHSLREWRDMSIKSIDGMLNEQVQVYLPNLNLPTLIIFGNKDALIPNNLIHLGESPEKIAKKGAALIPQSTYTMVADGGHFVHIEKATEVNQLIGRFIGQPYAKMNS
jgi:pimeloyl-ACP methyl ester carboxylesterase